MSFARLVIQRNFHLILTAGSLTLCLFSVVTMYRALRASQEPTLIAIDGNGTRIISRGDDPIFDTEAVQFCRLFVSKLYNFEPESFQENVGFASALLSLSLWKEEENKFLDLMKAVKQDQISMSGGITKILKTSTTEYSVQLKTKETTRANTQDRNLLLHLTLQRVERSKINPYGLEVTRYDETHID